MRVVCFPKDRMKRMKVGETKWRKKGMAMEPEGAGCRSALELHKFHFALKWPRPRE